MSRYKTSPSDIVGMPPGVPHIIGNEAAERFSFYGMKAVLAVFMVQYLHLMNDTPGEAMSKVAATEKVHLFNFWVYFTPLLGAFLSDIVLGKYKTIMWLSVVYVMGHATLAFMGVAGEAKHWLFVGLGLICLGSGGIKPCVSAHVGDQFGAINAHLLAKVFNWFYFSINVGAWASMLLTPWLLEWYGPHWAFGLPGVLMALATLLFWLGRHHFIHVPPGGLKTLEELASPEGRKTLLKLTPLYLFVAMFWALFDQTNSTWIFQAQDMDRNFLGFTWLPSQLQSLNSAFILTFIPLFAYVIYPFISKFWPLTPLRKIGLGLFIMSTSFAIVALVQSWIDGTARPNIGWQVLAYALLTASEVMVAIVALEFAYTQSPKTLKSIVMCFFLLSVALGNIFTAGINRFIGIPEPFTEEKLVQELPGDEGLQHPGFDGKIGTSDDLTKTPYGIINSPARPILVQALDILENEFQNGLPTESNSITALRDPWGQPLQYQTLNSRTARIRSAGPDKKSGTPWDLSVQISVPEPKPAAKKSWSDALHPQEPWLAKRKAELGIKDQAPLKDGRPFQVTYHAGGGTKLEGSSYFWLFAGLMLLTAFGYIPYSLRYQEKTVLQD